MENPLELPAPPEDRPIEQIHALARDIAYGASYKMWTSHLRVERTADEAVFSDRGLNEGLKNKWGKYHNYYSVHLLVSFGHLVKSNVNEVYREEIVKFYDLTPKAFALLYQPISTPSIFISYKQDTSSALGLLIEARLRLADPNINIFIDKLLLPGDEWKKELEMRVRGSKYLICLLCKEALDSQAVKDEITWALDTPDCRLIAVCHNSYRVDNSFPELLRDKQAIIVERESAKHYESAISDLLNSMGYSTY
jgi:hypothetical protein